MGACYSNGTILVCSNNGWWWRVLMLLISFGMVSYAGTILYQKLKKDYYA